MRGTGEDGHTDRGSVTVVALGVALVLGVVLLASVLAVGGEPLIPDDDQTADSPEPLNTTATERALTTAVNRERTARGLPPVGYDAGLAAVARNHSADMVARSYYSHESPEGDTAFGRVQAAPVSCASVGENIAAAWWHRPFDSLDGERERHTTVEQLAEGLVEQWLNSPDHRHNMLSSEWERTGVGVAVTDEGEVLVTQNFCG